MNLELSVLLVIFAVNQKLKRMDIMKVIIRELSKLAMFIILWGFPLLLAHFNHNNTYLWFLAVSVIATFGVFSHYEDLEKIDMVNILKTEKDER